MNLKQRVTPQESLNEDLHTYLALEIMAGESILESLEEILSQSEKNGLPATVCANGVIVPIYPDDSVADCVERYESEARARRARAFEKAKRAVLNRAVEDLIDLGFDMHGCRSEVWRVLDWVGQNYPFSLGDEDAQSSEPDPSEEVGSL